MGEHCLCKAGVAGSIPVVSTATPRDLAGRPAARAVSSSWRRRSVDLVLTVLGFVVCSTATLIRGGSAELLSACGRGDAGNSRGAGSGGPNGAGVSQGEGLGASEAAAVASRGAAGSQKTGFPKKCRGPLWRKTQSLTFSKSSRETPNGRREDERKSHASECNVACQRPAASESDANQIFGILSCQVRGVRCHRIRTAESREKNRGGLCSPPRRVYKRVLLQEVQFGFK